MNVQNMHDTLSDTATQTVSQSTATITKEVCQSMNDSELLNLVNKATGHTGKDFGEFMNCDFSYSFLTTELKNRGYINGWYNLSQITPPQKEAIIKMRKSDEETTRQSYMVDTSIAAEWKEFNKHVPYKTVTIGWAMKRFMDDYNSGRIKFELEL